MTRRKKTTKDLRDGLTLLLEEDPDARLELEVDHEAIIVRCKGSSKHPPAFKTYMKSLGWHFETKDVTPPHWWFRP